MRKRLCACGCGDRVTPKVELQHMNVLAPALLASQVLDQNRRLIQQKKRSRPIGFPAPFRQRLAMGMSGPSGTTEIDVDDNDPVSPNSPMMMEDDGELLRSGQISPHVEDGKSFQLVTLMKIFIWIMQMRTFIWIMQLMRTFIWMI